MQPETQPNRASSGELPRGIVGYRPALDEELFAFQRAAYPQRRVDWVMPRWRWMFLNSAQRCGTTPMVWLYRSKDGIVAHQGAIPVRFRFAGEEQLTGWFVETRVLESMRGRAVGPMLIKKALEDLPFNLSLGQTEQMRELQFALGWRQVTPLPVHALILNPAQVLQGKLHNPLARKVASATWTLGRSLRQRIQGNGHGTELEVVEITNFGDKHTQLWERVKGGYQCAVVRDSSYLNWKYVEQPGQEFVRLDLCRSGELKATLVLMFRDPDDAYQYRRAFIVDFVGPLDDPGILRGTLLAAAQSCQDRGADAVVLHALCRSLETAARACGFLRRPPTRFLLIATGGLEPSQAEALSTVEKWFLSMGDSDIDRPW